MTKHLSLLDRAYGSIEELLWTLEDAELIDGTEDCRHDEWGELCRGACEASGCLKAKRDRALAILREIDPARTPNLAMSEESAPPPL